jgi:serine/threonine-protein kinase
VARRAAARGPRLLPVAGAGRVGRNFCTVFEVGGARPLSELLTDGPLPVDEALVILEQIADALDEASLPPFELSPESVFIDPRRGVVLGDLGVARDAFRRRAGMRVASSPYVPPEVRAGQSADRQSAVYCFGALMYTVLAGRAPSAEEVLDRPDLPPLMREVVDHAMAAQPARRYPSCRAALQLARTIVVSSAHHALPAQRQKMLASRRRGVGLAAALALLALAGAGGGALLASAIGDPDPPRPTRVSATGLTALAPAGWEGRGGESLRASPPGDRRSGLSAELVEEDMRAGLDAEPVRLGALEAWREDDPDPPGYRAAVRYLVPTEAGTLVIRCQASLRAESGLLSTCERAASTVRLRRGRALPLSARATTRQRIVLAITGLERRVARAHKRLAAAERPAGQALMAEVLARAHQRSSDRLEALASGDPAIALLDGAALAYRELAAAAAARDRAEWNAARAAVRERQAELRPALDALAG